MTARPLHERVARAWTRSHRAGVAGAVAAAVSAIAWALGLPAPLHALAVALSAAVAAVWPRRDRRASALRWLGGRVGLAYETALEAEDREDPHGLLAAVRTQGRLVVRDVAVPSTPAWWVPAALLAFTLWAWGAWVGAPWSPPWGAAGDPGGPPPTTSVPPPTLDAEAPADPAPETVAPPETGARAGDGADGARAGGGDADGGGAAGAASERDALERFVQNLREREAEAAALGGAADVDEATEAEDEPSGDAATTTGREPGTELPTGPRAPDPGGDGERAEGDEAPADADAEGSGAGGEGDQAGEGTPGGDGATPDAGAPEGAAGEGPEGDGAAGAAGVDPGDETGQAGLGAGAEGEAGAPATEGLAEPEALPSLLGEGTETPIGGLVLPGVAGDAEAFPAGPAGAAFRRAVERALGDGEVPVSYQEVIRNYFR